MPRRISLCLMFVLALGCEKGNSKPPTVFGGEGAKVEGADSHPLTEEDDRPRLSGPCSEAPPAGKDALLDDFEDGDHQLFKTYHREGWWFVADDGTEGAEYTPKKGEFAPVQLPKGEATANNEMALHLTARGMQDWGVGWGTTLHFKKDGLTCPFNGSHFEGIRFRAKGPGTIKIKINTIETTPPDNGGVCQEGCWDSHAKIVRLKEDWREYFIRWEELQQGGWGTDSRFDSSRLLTLNFTAAPEMLPSDFWVDDVRFIQKGEKPAPLPKAKHPPDSAQEASEAKTPTEAEEANSSTASRAEVSPPPKD